jgi:hypothetical protein
MRHTLAGVGAGGVRDRFQGSIAGVGFTSGFRAVIGCWDASPFGAFSDVMLQYPGRDGERVLIAPTQQVGDYVTATYSFDRVLIEGVTVTRVPSGWALTSDTLALRCGFGRRTWVGHALAPVPDRLLTAPAFCAAVDPIARQLVPGVRTAGQARPGRWEFYGAVDQRVVTDATATLSGRSLGRLAPVSPACTFGFSSTPRRPVVTRLVTTVVR